MARSASRARGKNRARRRCSTYNHNTAMGPTQRSSRRGAADNRANPLNTPLEYTLGAARSTISVSVARTVLDRHAATALVALRYEWRGYSVPDSSESSPSEYML